MKQLGLKGIKLLKSSEGCSLTAYLCPAKVLTIGYGHTGNVNPKQVITQAQADAMLTADMARFVARVNNTIKVALTQNQFDALVVLCFNIGEDAFKYSTLARILNAGKYSMVPSEMRRWNKVQGTVHHGLENRRENEIKLWNTK